MVRYVQNCHHLAALTSPIIIYTKLAPLRPLGSVFNPGRRLRELGRSRGLLELHGLYWLNCLYVESGIDIRHQRPSVDILQYLLRHIADKYLGALRHKWRKYSLARVGSRAGILLLLQILAPYDAINDLLFVRFIARIHDLQPPLFLKLLKPFVLEQAIHALAAEIGLPRLVVQFVHWPVMSVSACWRTPNVMGHGVITVMGDREGVAVVGFFFRVLVYLEGFTGYNCLVHCGEI